MCAKIDMTNRWLLMLLTLSFLISSCSNDEDTTPDNDYCYIKSVTLGTVNRKIDRYDRQGNHIGTVNASFSGSTYAMSVNQRTGVIENIDSLPFGSQLSAVLATITFEGSVLNYQNSNGEWIAYNTEDSLDLSKLLQLQLTSNNGASKRAYSIKINVHQQEGDSLYWKQCEKDVTPLLGMTDMKSFVKDDKLMVLGQKTTGIVLAERSGIEAEGSWGIEQSTNLPATADLQTIHQHADKLYISTTDGDILSSIDAKSWTQEGNTYSAPLTLIEKSDNYFYAISGGKLLRSADAITWEEDKANSEAFSDAEYLPDAGIRAMTVVQANGSSRIIMLGQRTGSANTVVWNKTWNKGWDVSEADAEWMYFLLSPDNNKLCPRLNYLNLLSYDGKSFAFGGASLDDTHKALDAIYISQDYGLTWHPDTEYHMPIQLEGIDECITSVVDKNHYIWIITKAQVWRGRLNRLGFAQQ